MSRSTTRSPEPAATHGERFTPVEAALLAILVATSMSVFVVQAVDAAINNRVYVGADGLYPTDQLQYLAWATDAAHHGLIANLYALDFGKHVFLHPVWLLTGWVHVNVGLSYPFLLVVWKLAVLVALFFLLRSYARSLLGAPGPALVAVALALFMLSPSQLIVNRIAPGQTGPVNLELFSVYWLQGYFPIALAVTAMIVFLKQSQVLVTEAALPKRELRVRVAAAAAAGVTAAWLHPWQGLTLLVIVAGVAVWERDAWRRHLRLLVPAVATAAPVLYYGVLRQVDVGWEQAQHYNASGLVSRETAAIFISLLPIALLMLPGYAERATTSADRMLQLWPVAIVVVYAVSPSDRWHALGGFSVPAALLIVRGWPWVRRRFAHWPRARVKAVAAVGVCVAVAAAPLVIAKRIVTPRSGDRHAAEIARDDARALERLATPSSSGGVLTTAELGAWVPAITGRPTWVGHETWTPSYSARKGEVALLFSGQLDGDPARERAFVRSTRAAIVLEPCGSRARLERALAPAGFGAARVGCTTVYSKQ